MSHLAIVFSVFVYVLAGAFAGLMSGIFGIGGGIVVVPALLYIFQFTQAIPEHLLMHFAVGTSLAVMLFTAQASVRSHRKHGKILWDVYHRLWPGIIFGVMSGAFVANFIPTNWLQLLFGLFLLFVSWKMLSGMNVTRPHGFPRTSVNALISYLIGFKSGMLGVGGGTLIIPYLSWCGVNARKIAAVSALCTFTVALTGSVLFVLTGIYEPYHSATTIGYIYWPAVFLVAIPSMLTAPLGTKLNYILPIKQLKYAFVILLVITAVDLII